MLAYSGGAALAAQIIIRHVEEHPLASPNERPFRFAVFINGATPLRVFRVADVDVAEGEVDISALQAEAAGMFLRPSAVRKKSGVHEDDQPDQNVMLELFAALQGRQMVDGTVFMSDGTYGLMRYDAQGRVLIDIPTLHVRSPEEDRHHGACLLGMCEEEKAREYHHGYGHDFPRGWAEMKKIAQLIRETAESA